MRHRRLGWVLFLLGYGLLFIWAIMQGFPSLWSIAGILGGSSVILMVLGICLAYPLAIRAERTFSAAVLWIALIGLMDGARLLAVLAYPSEGTSPRSSFGAFMALGLGAIGLGLLFHRLAQQRGEPDAGYWLGRQFMPRAYRVSLWLVVPLLVAYLLLGAIALHPAADAWPTLHALAVVVALGILLWELLRPRVAAAANTTLPSGPA